MKTKTFEIGRDFIESSITDLISTGIKVNKKNILDNINKVLTKCITNNGTLMFDSIDDILENKYNINWFDEHNEEHVKLYQSICNDIQKLTDKYY